MNGDFASAKRTKRERREHRREGFSTLMLLSLDINLRFAEAKSSFTKTEGVDTTAKPQGAVRAPAPCFCE